MTRTRSAKTIDRDRRLKKYKADHPDMTVRAIGKVFHISHVMVLRILKALYE